MAGANQRRAAAGNGLVSWQWRQLAEAGTLADWQKSAGSRHKQTAWLAPSSIIQRWGRPPRNRTFSKPGRHTTNPATKIATKIAANGIQVPSTLRNIA